MSSFCLMVLSGRFSKPTVKLGVDFKADVAKNDSSGEAIQDPIGSRRGLQEVYKRFIYQQCFYLVGIKKQLKAALPKNWNICWLPKDSELVPKIINILWRRKEVRFQFWTKHNHNFEFSNGNINKSESVIWHKNSLPQPLENFAIHVRVKKLLKTIVWKSVGFTHYICGLGLYLSVYYLCRYTLKFF